MPTSEEDQVNTQNTINIDIVVEASRGPTNATIVGDIKTNRPVQDVEYFWLAITETILPSFISDA